ncbi:peptide MFS transporter [Streptomyces violaceusniger]|uniref:peptide MFS transporter n=1 Tax=Streptomyces violaceusniger TaxID=68280 RepID=UPI000996984D|nr:oligopeptide:H+ symporter [Streptomyces hygroscopicus]AQW48338.1 peptide transporter [Streptomyces hygroscopicus]
MAVKSTVKASPSGSSRSRQPRGFWNLAVTELWERFSFYGLQAVLTFYLVYSLADGGLAMERTTAVSIVGAYGAGVYLAQVLGAWASDHLVAPRRMVLIGAVIIALGHVSLAVLPGGAGLAAGLSLVAVGTGALKTNITAIIGMMLADRDREGSDAGFSLFYLAINVGAVMGPLLTGLLQSRAGFHYAFGLAAIGMGVALVQYSLNYRRLPEQSKVVKASISRSRTGIALGAVVVMAVVAAVLWRTGLVDGANLNYVMGMVIVVVAMSYFSVVLRSRLVTGAERRRVGGYIPMWLAEVAYYALNLQIFTTVPLFVTDRVRLDVLGWQVPEAWFSSIGNVALVLFIPLMAGPWRRGAVGRLAPPAKFALGIGSVSVAYLLMLLTGFWAPGKTVSPLLVASCLILAGISEVFVGPIGFTVVTRIAPEAFATQLVALKILTLGAGSTLSGILGAYYTHLSPSQYFVVVGGLGLLCASVLALAARRVESLIQV